MKGDNQWSIALVRVGACTEAVQWARKHRSFRSAWNTCRRGEWMDWLVRKFGLFHGNALRIHDVSLRETVAEYNKALFKARAEHHRANKKALRYEPSAYYAMTAESDKKYEAALARAERAFQMNLADAFRAAIPLKDIAARLNPPMDRKKKKKVDEHHKRKERVARKATRRHPRDQEQS